MQAEQSLRPAANEYDLVDVRRESEDNASEAALVDVGSHATPLSSNAWRSAQSRADRDGTRLAGLMIEHHVGVSERSVAVPRVDQDFFPEE
jgi:hypothetical protein